MPERTSEETKRFAVRLVLEHLGEYSNLTAACQAVGAKLGLNAWLLRRWVRQAQANAAGREGATTGGSGRIRGPGAGDRGRFDRTMGRPGVHPDVSLDRYLRALASCRADGDGAGEGAALASIGSVHYGRGDLDAALDCFEQALAIFQRLDDQVGEATVLANIARLYRSRDDLGRALDFFGRALPIFRRVGDRVGEAVILYDIAMIHRLQGRLDQAVAELEQVVELDRLTRHPGLDSAIRVFEDIRRQQRG